MITDKEMPAAATTAATAGTTTTAMGTVTGSDTAAAAATMIMATMDMDTAFNVLFMCSTRPPC